MARIIGEGAQRWESMIVSKPDVALITPSFEGGGVERVMLNLANGLAARGISVDLVAISAHGPFREQVAESVQIVDLAAPRMVKAILPLARYLRRERPAAVLAALDYINVATVWANVLAGSPARVVVSTHKFFSISTKSSPREQITCVSHFTVLFCSSCFTLIYD